jgi:hypothetical protein
LTLVFSVHSFLRKSRSEVFKKSEKIPTAGAADYADETDLIRNTKQENEAVVVVRAALSASGDSPLKTADDTALRPVITNHAVATDLWSLSDFENTTR